MPGRSSRILQPHSRTGCATRNYCTVSIAVPLTPFMPAEIVEVPAAIPLAVPFALTVATDGVEELQSTWLVIFITEPSLKVPFAVNTCEPPTLTAALPGVTAIEFRVALVTVIDAVPTWPLNTAEMVTLPG